MSDIPKNNGWSRYEYAVMTKLEEMGQFIAETRAFMSRVESTLNQHADHPERLARLEAHASQHDAKIGLLTWKVGAIAAVLGAGGWAFMHLVIGNVEKLLGG